MKATEQYFPVVLFIMLYKAVQTFESVDKILKCDHSNETNQPIIKFWNSALSVVSRAFTFLLAFLVSSAKR